MIDYHELARQKPELFSNDNALLRLVMDKDEIQAWQSHQASLLMAKGLPSEWAQIGVILDDPYNFIVRDLVQFPDGDARGYGRSIAVSSLRGGKGTVILPKYRGKILLLHQYRHPTRQWHYEVPRGYGEPNTSPDDNARKEIQEETGGQVSVLVNLGEFYNNTGYEAIPVSLFYAELSSVGAANRNEGIESFVWKDVKELEEWIGNGTVTDGFTIAVYTKAKLRGLI